MGYSDSFLRMWNYYYCYCEGAFMERAIGNVQMLLVRPDCRRDPIVPQVVPSPVLSLPDPPAHAVQASLAQSI